MQGGPTFIGRFALVSLAVTACIALGFGWLLSRWMIDRALDDAVRGAADTVSAAITPQIASEDFADPTPASVTAWQRRLRQVIGGDIARVKVWNAEGQIVYSDNPALIGRVFPLATEDQLRAALTTGRPASDLSVLANPEYARERAYGRLLEIYAPITLAGGSKPVGAYEVYRQASPLVAKIEDIKQVVWRTSAAAIGLLFASLFFIVNTASRSIIRQQEDLRQASVGTVRALVSALEIKDSDTASHSTLVAEYAAVTAKALGLSDEICEDIRMAAYLHGLGKNGIPDEVLRMPSTLSPEEGRQTRRHPPIGAGILEAVPFSPRIKLAVRHNHERWDGAGYPDGLAGEDIPMEARILAVADAYEAMTSNRPYRPTMAPVLAMDELTRHVGTQFDPRVIEAFMRALGTQRDGEPVRDLLPTRHPHPSSAV
ncbi:MAG TPA: HD-GYP domain-containing protein [bacterium]|nr:HD-GYP domain-containing protein [bacterium]